MNRLLILAALLLSVAGGLTLMSSSSPVAAQTDPSATRSFDSTSVEPGGTLTVSIDVVGIAAVAGSVTETLPAGFTYVSTTNRLGATQTGSDVRFRVFGGNTSFTYEVTAPMEEKTYSFGGTLKAGPGVDAVPVGGTSDVVVATTPPQTGPDVTSNDLSFDVVKAQAVKGATVSGVGNPISTNPLKWVVDNSEGMTLGDFDGSVGDFEVVETDAGDEFMLKVAESGAPNLSGSHTIRVTLPYTNAEGEVVNSTLTGTITARDALLVAGPVEFTIPQDVGSGTPIHYFNVSGAIADKNESLDGIISGADAAPFGVNDANMTIYRRNGANLEVKDYEFHLTVNGDAGLAARTHRVNVTIAVTASNDKHSHDPGTFAATIYENIKGDGLVSAGTAVGDASAGITNPDDDKLTYSENSPLFEIDSDTGAITVGPDDIADGMEGSQSFEITVSDGVTANDVVIMATVMVDDNAPVTAKSDDLPADVTHSAPATYTVTTPEVAGTVNGYHILDVADLVNLDLDENGVEETPEYTPSVRTAPLNVDDDGRLLLTHVPRTLQDGAEDEALVPITVEIDDGYNPSITITINVVLNVRERPDQITPSLTASIDENKTGVVQAALTTLVDTGNDTLDALIAEINQTVAEGDGVEYKHTGGTNGGEPGAGAIFEVDDETGAISLNTEQDADELGADEMPSVVLQVERDSDGADIGVVFVAITINDVNEAPVFASDTAYGWVSENAVVNSAVKMSSDRDAADFMPMATDDDGDSLTYTEDSDLFGIMDGKLVVTGMLDADEGRTSHTVVITASDGRDGTDTQTVTVMVGDANDDPEFVDPDSAATIVPIDRSVVSIDENATVKVVDFKVVDTDGANNTLSFSLDDGVSQNLFEIRSAARSATDSTVWTGELWTKAGLDYEGSGAFPYNVTTGYTVLVLVNDGNQGDDTLTVHVTLNDVNDNAPEFATNNAVIITVVENAARGTALPSAIAADGVYSASDGDGTAPNNTVTYSIDSKSFYIDSSTGLLTVLESLDADSGTPCGSAGCHFKITATDGGNPSMTDTLDVTVNVSNAEDSVSTFKVSKANPVPGVSMGDPRTALADAKTGAGKKGVSVADNWNSLGCAGMLWLVGSTDASVYCKMYDGLSADAKAEVGNIISNYPAESPIDLPAVGYSNMPHTVNRVGAPYNFVEADWASWDTVLRVEVTAESPDNDCGNGNQCVYIDAESDSAGNELRLAAYRSAMQENLFIAAVMVVEKDPTDDGDGDHGNRNDPVHMHSDGKEVVRLEVDEEDEVSFRLVGSTAPPINIDVENEDPEFSNFMPEHEAAFDDGDVEYTFTITDSVSGIPEPEDLAGDTDGDGDYMPLVALISDSQCELVEYDENGNVKVAKGYTYNPKAPDNDDYYPYAGNAIWCEDAPEIRQVVDDRDFDEIDDGFEVSTEVVLPENQKRYVTFIVCDNAGNCAMYTPDENAKEEALAEITIDTKDPELVEARTGIKWDSIDEELDLDNKTWIQVIFEDLSTLDEDTVEKDDFVVEGHTVKDVFTYGDDADEGSGEKARRMVFVELEDELAPDETPDVTLVPNGIADKAGNEQDDGEAEAKDFISPSFTVVSIVAPKTPEGSSNHLAGEDDEVMITITSDERIVETRPSVRVSYVNAPSGSVYTKVGTADTCDAEGTDDGKRVRGEIVNNDNCQDSDAARGSDGSELGATIEKISNTEWKVTVDEPASTGYYNIYISGHDRSAQRNQGDEGVAPDDIVTDFFERDGDVNSDDAHYFQGDVNLSNPGVRVSGVQVEDTEPTVEFKSPLFVELDFTRPYIKDCADNVDDDERDANCYAESDEYAKDSFDSVTIKSFTLNGVDMTGDVKTTDNETFLVSLEGIEIGDHEIEIQAMDQAGNELDKALSVEFEVEERDPFDTRLNPGWNLVSLPGEPADSDISVVFGSDMEVRTVYTYNPIIPGGWMVAVRETKDSEWQGDLTEITARQGYWVLSDAIQDWEVSIPRLAGGAVGSGTPIQPPVIALYAGWNLVPVVDVTGDFAGGGISATTYLQSLDDGLDLARVLGFDTITNKWSTVMAPECGSACDSTADKLHFGKAYWVFVRQAASLVPGN